MSTQPQKDIILFLWRVTDEHIASIEHLRKATKVKYRIFLLTYSKYEVPKELKDKIEVVLKTNLKNMGLVEKKLAPHKENIAAIINRWESTMPLYGRLFEIFPYLSGPSLRSMRLASNKFEMRKAFARYDKKITPEFLIVRDATDKTIRQIKDKVGFPCIIKPIGLSHSRLITVAYYEDELKSIISRTFKKLNSKIK
jgi:glutathione synthase/RimK-type ligase-like ATP-grasp enzyme